MTQYNLIEPNPGPDPKNLFIAIVLTTVVLMVYSYFFAPPTVTIDEGNKKITIEEQKLPPKETIAHEEATDVFIPKEYISFINQEKLTDEYLLRRTSYEVVISNHGGDINKYVLTSFKNPEILFDKAKTGSSLLKLSFTSPSLIKHDLPYEIILADGSNLKLRHITKDGLLIERFYQFLDKSSMRENITIKNMAKEPLKVEMALSAVKVSTNEREPGIMNPGVEGNYMAVKTADKYQRISYGDLKDKPSSFLGIKYIAFDDQFFLSAIMPSYQNHIDHAEVLVKEKDKSKIAHLDLFISPFILLAEEEKLFSHDFYIGPKQIDLLASFTTPLDENIDFGWFSVLSRPMLWLLVQIYLLVKNYGLAIILITCVIKLLTYPLTKKSFSSQVEMKKLQPKIAELTKKFGHDRTLLGQKQMELYKSHGINPLAGCLPLLIQLPIWFAFFQMLRNSVELYDQPFYWWIKDLTKPDPYVILPILMGISMLVQQIFTPPPSDQPHMKYVMWFMPVFLTIVMLNMPSGLSLYILTNNLLTIGQQVIMKKRSEQALV